jgi:hypothetical protein
MEIAFLIILAKFIHLIAGLKSICLLLLQLPFCLAQYKKPYIYYMRKIVGFRKESL